MLEERLSNTYNQHSIGGYNLPPQRPASTIYPSTASGPTGATSTAESFYTGNPQQEPYGRPQSTLSYAPAQQYQQYDNRAAAYGRPEQREETFAQNHPQQQPMQIQRTGSWQDSSQQPVQYATQQPGFTAENTSLQHQAPPNPNSQPTQSHVQVEPMATPTDSNAAFYYGNPAAPSQPQPVPDQHISYPQQSPQQYKNTVLPQQAVSPQLSLRQLHQPEEQYVAPQQQYAPPSQPVSQQPAYWQPQQTGPRPQSWQAPGSTHNGYTQDSFPSAPQHTIQPKIVEESLIDL